MTKVRKRVGERFCTYNVKRKCVLWRYPRCMYLISAEEMRIFYADLHPNKQRPSPLVLPPPVVIYYFCRDVELDSEEGT